MKKLILAALLAAVMLTGCDNGQAGTMVEGSVYPKITQYGRDTGEYTYFYAVDERTGTVYLLFDAYWKPVYDEYRRLGYRLRKREEGRTRHED